MRTDYTMATIDGSDPNTRWWCSGCAKIHKDTDVVFYVDIGRMCHEGRSGRLVEIDQARRLGLVPDEAV